MNLRITKTDFLGDCNIGLFGFSTEKFCLVGNKVDEKNIKSLESLLKVPVFQVNLNFVGIFVAGNSDGILLPSLVAKHEFEMLKKILDCNIATLNSKYTALGNLVLANDNGAVVSELLGEKEIKSIESCLGVKVVKGRVAKTKLPGSGAFATNNAVLLHRGAAESEKELIENALDVKSNFGTANFGSPWVGACMIGNSKGVVVGTKTTIHEIVRIDETFLETETRTYEAEFNKEEYLTRP